MRILDINKIVDITGLSRRTIYSLISENEFPKSVQLTSRRVGWIESEVQDWINKRVASRDSQIVA